MRLMNGHFKDHFTGVFMRQSTIIFLFGIILTSFMITGFQCGSAEVTSAKLYEQRQDWANMEKALLKEVDKNPNNAEAWFLLGRARLMQGNYKDMLPAFDQSLKVSNEFEKNIVDFKKFAWGASLNQGVNFYNKSVTASPDSATMLLSKAIEAYTVAIMISPDSAINYQNMAVAQRAQGNHDEEIKYLKLALDRKKDPQTSTFLINAYLQKAGELKKSGKDATEYYNAAIDELTKARVADPENQELLGTLINVYIDASRPKEAVPFIREAVARDPKNKIFQNDLGLLLMEADSLEQAIEHFEASLTVDNMFEDALRNGAVAYLKLGDRMKDAARAKVDSKDSKEVDRSYIEKFKQAINLLERLKEKKSNDPNVWDALATAYGNAGMIEKAKEAIKESDKLRNK
jgi:tetratricopeptide (TPR) repeat protein